MANTEWSFPFADSNGDRMYSDADFAKFFSAWFVNGVFINVGGGLQLIDSVAGGMRITLKSGAANINGRVYYLNTDTDFTVPVASPVQDRTDSVTVKLDITNRTMNVIYKQGDTSVTRNNSVYELQIATIFVAKNISEITPDMISDMRTNKSVCGLASPNDPIDVDSFTTQFKALFDKQLTDNGNDFTDWFDNLKNELDSNQATNLQNQITNIQDSIRRYQILDGYDLNGYKQTGDFIINGVNNLVNYPVGASSYAMLHVEELNNGTAIQTLTTTDNIIYTRVYGGDPSSFGNWFQQLNDTTNQNIYGNNSFKGENSFEDDVTVNNLIINGTLFKKVATANVQNAGVAINGGTFDIYRAGNMYYFTTWTTALDGSVTNGQSVIANITYTSDSETIPGIWEAMPSFFNTSDGSTVDIQLRSGSQIQFNFRGARGASDSAYIRIGGKLIIWFG